MRIIHWSLVAGTVLAWLTRHGGAWHEWIGYAALALVALRIVWGFAGHRYARFGRFLRTPAYTLRYARLVTAHREPRYLGHNPLGGWMVVALLAMIAAAGLSGWLYTTDAFWGEEWMENLHWAFATTVLVLAALHVAGVMKTSLRHRENLVGAMIHGCKRPPQDGDMA